MRSPAGPPAIPELKKLTHGTLKNSLSRGMINLTISYPFFFPIKSLFKNQKGFIKYYVVKYAWITVTEFTQKLRNSKKP